MNLHPSDRFTGALLALACGDALGAPAERERSRTSCSACDNGAMPARTTDEVLEKSRRHFAERPHRNVVSAYLFGSHAEGRDHRESDVDVAVLLDREMAPAARQRFDRRVELGSELIQALGTPRVDVLVLNDAPPLLARKIVMSGIQIYCSDPDRDRDFRRDVQLRAADLAPFLDRYRRIKLDALAR